MEKRKDGLLLHLKIEYLEQSKHEQSARAANILWKFIVMVNSQSRLPARSGWLRTMWRRRIKHRSFTCSDIVPGPFDGAAPASQLEGTRLTIGLPVRFGPAPAPGRGRRVLLISDVSCFRVLISVVQKFVILPPPVSFVSRVLASSHYQAA